jgi:hypothetical protein
MFTVKSPLDELFRPVQRIDDQEGLRCQSMACRLFLGDQHHIGESRTKTSRDQRIRRLIRLGHRACVRF